MASRQKPATDGGNSTMSDLRDLYQEVILDHTKRPRNHHKICKVTHEADGVNPLCGDKVHLYLDVEEGVVKDIGFEGTGCAISTASASMLTEVIKGKSMEEVNRLFQGFHDLVTGKITDPAEIPGLGKLAAFTGVSEYPVRVKCATLVWHTMKAALEKQAQSISTESL
jgi:nitrogen fixation NifU-like protein